MRTLKFIVNAQSIIQNPECDFTGLVPGTKGYLEAEFSFSDEWSGTAKVVEFSSNLGREYAPQVLMNNKVCVIPYEALKNRIFKIRVIGKKGDFEISTNKLAVCQNGGKV